MGVELGVLQESPPGLIEVAGDINKHNMRVYGDSNGARRRKALEKERTPRKWVGSLNVALGYVGAWLAPEYEGARRSPARYALRWEWKDPPGADTPDPPEPRPTHPKRPPEPGEGPPRAR